MLKIQGGHVYDPANGIDGEIKELWVEDGRIVAPPSAPHAETFEVLDVSGHVIMPGGVDMHCHVAGPKVNTARKMQPEMLRDAPNSVPNILTTGHKYIGLGYTTCFDAAITPMAARHVHHELNDLPNVDAGFFVLTGNNHLLLESIAAQDEAKTAASLGWLLKKTGAYAPKIVNPGGVELWKQRRDGNARDLDQWIDGFQVTPRSILEGITRAANHLNLPHPVHIHCNNLGIPGNWTTTLESMKAVSGQTAHFTHIQFHSYGQGEAVDPEQNTESVLTSQVPALAEFINQDPNLSVDVGQVLFGRTTSMTGDGPLGYFLHQVNGQKWFSADTELESGCGISPIDYRNTNYVHAMQWAIGLEWYLLVENPWQVVMSTDHPNGGSFQAYPQIIRLLMDFDYRQEKIAELPPQAISNTVLKDLKRTYSLSEIAIITRAGPARLLGLKRKGQLGVGADADLTIYTPSENYEQMFELPRWVFKGGRPLIRDHEVCAPGIGDTLFHTPEYDVEYDSRIESWFDRHYTINSKNFGVNLQSNSNE